MSGGLVAFATWWAHVETSLDFSALAAALEVDDPGLDAASTVADLTAWARSAGHVPATSTSLGHRRTPHGAPTLPMGGRRRQRPGGHPRRVRHPGARRSPGRQPATELTYGTNWDICRDGGVSRLALSRFFNHWRARQNLTLAEAARWLLGDYVIRQHERVAIAKLAQNGDTFRSRRQGDHLRFYEADAPARMRNSRFQALATTVYELGFVDSLYRSTHTLTPDGLPLLADGDLPERHLDAAMAEADHGH